MPPSTLAPKIGAAPLTFRRRFRPAVWGGRRLGRFLGQPLPDAQRIGESWEVSGHPSHVAAVAGGALDGAPLDELCRRHAGPLLGGRGEFPFLLKWLDCSDRLSVQVHPDDAHARQLLGEPCGKTEAWVVVDTVPGARVYAGLTPGTTRAAFEKHLADGTAERCLHAFEPRPGDCLFLPAGTIHAAGGVLLAEVQQPSDATFRLHDWGRVGPDGTPRELHTGVALGCAAWDSGPVGRVTPVPLPALPAGVLGERLVRCRHFRLDRFAAAAPFAVPWPGRLAAWMVLAGGATLATEPGGHRRRCRRGDTVVVPACAVRSAWHPDPGGVTLLCARTP